MHVSLWALLAASVACSGGERQVTPAPNQLVGTWRALEYMNPGEADSAHKYPFGRPPRGYLVYDATGHVFFQAVRGLTASAEARGRWEHADSFALRELLSDAAAYFGTYRVLAGGNTVVHRIEGEIPPNLGTTEIATPYRVNGDTLVLGRDSSVQWIFTRVRQ